MIATRLGSIRSCLRQHVQSAIRADHHRQGTHLGLLGRIVVDISSGIDIDNEGCDAQAVDHGHPTIDDRWNDAPEAPYTSITAGIRSEPPLGIRNSPARVASLPDLSPVTLTVPQVLTGLDETDFETLGITWTTGHAEQRSHHNNG